MELMIGKISSWWGVAGEKSQVVKPKSWSCHRLQHQSSMQRQPMPDRPREGGDYRFGCIKRGKTVAFPSLCPDDHNLEKAGVG